MQETELAERMASEANSSMLIDDLPIAPTVLTKVSTSLPLSRIKKIMKSDKEVGLCSNDAVFLTAEATKLFIESFAEHAYSETQRAKLKTVMYKDVGM